MISRTLPWLASLPLLVLLFFSPGIYILDIQNVQEPALHPSQSNAAMMQASTETPGIEPTPAPTSRPRRPTPTPLPLERQRNPGLVVGVVVIVAIILLGVLRFNRGK